MALPFGSIGQLALGNLVSRGADRLLNPEQRNNRIINSLIPGGGITGEGTGDENKNTRSKTFGDIAKSILVSPPLAAINGSFPVAALVILTSFTAEEVVPNTTHSLPLASAMNPPSANLAALKVLFFKV